MSALNQGIMLHQYVEEIIKNRTHTICITLQVGEYKGHIAYEAIINRLPENFLESLFKTTTQEDINYFLLNDCNLAYNEERECFSGTLKDDEENELRFDDWPAEKLTGSIVKVDINDTNPSEQTRKVIEAVKDGRLEEAIRNHSNFDGNSIYRTSVNEKGEVALSEFKEESVP